MSFGLSQPISTTIIVDDNEQLSQILDELDDAPGRLNALELRAGLLETSDVAQLDRVATIETRSDSLDGRATSLESRASAQESFQTTTDNRLTDIEAASTSLNNRTGVLESRASALESFDADAGERLDALELVSANLTASLTSLLGFSGSVPLTVAFQSPSNRWVPVDDRKDVIECTIANGVARLWIEISNLDVGKQYSLEIRLLLRDGGTAVRRITARARLCSRSARRFPSPPKRSLAARS